MTRNPVQPYMNPQIGPYASRRYAYCPPASGYAAPSSATERAPSSETAPPTIHTRIISAAPGTSAATSAGTMKIAVAIIVPTLIIVASNRPSSRLRSVEAEVECGDVIWFYPCPEGPARPLHAPSRALEGYSRQSNRPTFQPYSAASL